MRIALKNPIGMRCAWIYASIAIQICCRASEYSDKILGLLTNEYPIIRVEHQYRYSNSTNGVSIIAARQANTFYVQTAENGTNGTITPKQEYFGKSYNHYWAIGKNIVKFSPIADTSKGEAEVLRLAAEHQLEVVLNALTFGVAHLSGQARSLGSGEFEGDTERAGPLKGKVIDAGESVQIEYTVASQTNRVYYSEIPIRSFNANLLPLEYRRYNVQNGRRFELGVGHFAVFEIGSTNLSSSGGYVPSMFQATNSPKELFMISSNAAFSVAESGAMVEVPTVNSAPKAPGDNNVLVIIAGVLLFVACNIVVFLWLISRARNTNRDKHI